MRTRGRSFRCGALGLVLCAAVLSGCARKPRRVVIGVAVSQEFHAVMAFAANEINAAGGLDGRPVELYGTEWNLPKESDNTNVELWCARFAALPELVAVVGPSDSDTTLRVARALNQRAIPELVTIATHPRITNIGPWTYRLCISDAVQGPVLANYAVKEWGKRRIAVFAVNDDYGRGIAEGFGNRARSLGADLISTSFLHNPLTTSDEQVLKGTLTAMAKDPPDLFVLFQRPAAAESTLRAIRKAGLKTDVLGGDNIDPASLLQSEPALKEGLRASSFFFPRPEEPRALELQEKLRKERITAGYGAAYAYDAVQVIAEAVRAGGATREAVKAHLDRLIADKRVVAGASGDFTLGADHDARRQIHVVEFRDGAMRIVKSLSAL